MRDDPDFARSVGRSVVRCIENGIADTSFDLLCPLGAYRVTVEPILLLSGGPTGSAVARPAADPVAQHPLGTPDQDTGVVIGPEGDGS